MSRFYVLPLIFFLQFHSHQVTAQPVQYGQNPTIKSLIEAVHADSLVRTIRDLENFRTRYCLNPNRWEVAAYLKNRFLDMGITDVRLDSFQINRNGILYWQANVVATIPGTRNPDELMVIGGHYDSISQSDLTQAPGANDNASGTAGTLELARVVMTTGFKPEVTLKFVAFAAEELGLHGGYHMANTLKSQGKTVSLMLNMDMIAVEHRARSNWSVLAYYYGSQDTMPAVAIQYAPLYSGIRVLPDYSGSSDHVPFVLNGFPSIIFFIGDDDPNYHTAGDLLSACNPDYMEEVVKLTGSVMVGEQWLPKPVRNPVVRDGGDGQSLHFSWVPGSGRPATSWIVKYEQPGSEPDSVETTQPSVLITGLTEGQLTTVSIIPRTGMDDVGFPVLKTGTPTSVPSAVTGVTDLPGQTAVQLNWNPSTELDITGYRVYRSETPEEKGILISGALVTSLEFTNEPGSVEGYWYYRVVSVDQDGNESPAGEAIRSRLVTLLPGILLVDETFNGTGALLQPTDKQVDDFYAEALAGWKVAFHDADEMKGAKLADMGQFSTVIWAGDDLGDQTMAFNAIDAIDRYLGAGGHFLYSGYKPERAFYDSPSNSVTFPETSFMQTRLGVKEMFHMNSTYFNQAEPVSIGFQQVRMDSSKTKSSMKYHLNNISTVQPSDGTEILQVYGTGYAEYTTSGKLKGLPVALRTGKGAGSSVVLTYPLYYSKPADAKAFLASILSDWGETVLGADTPEGLHADCLHLFPAWPNPFNGQTQIKYYVGHQHDIRLTVYDVLGREVTTLQDENKPAGHHQVQWGPDHEASGVYFGVLRAGNQTRMIKLVLVK